MKTNQISLANKIYLILAGLFITSLVASNLIFTKIFYWYPFDINFMGVKLFELSVGILPYPLTFLITDLISEIYGQKKADQVVITGIFASVFSILLIAQFIDIRVYHFWKRLTKGKHLWLRNNFSTFTSQFVDTFTIVSLLIIFEILPQDKFLVLIVSGFLFKVMVAIFDTPLLYLCVWLFRRKFNLKVGEEIKLN